MTVKYSVGYPDDVRRRHEWRNLLTEVSQAIYTAVRNNRDGLD